MMKRILLMSLLALALPLAAFADNSVDFQNNGGTLAGSSSGLTLSGSTLTAVTGFNGMGLVQGSNLGSVSFTTAGETSALPLTGSATFAAGGTFTITSNGINGLPAGTIFSGTFTSPVTWTALELANGTWKYTLQGAISGTWYNGAQVFGATIQITTNTGKGGFSGSTSIGSGDTNIDAPTVPEPGTLGLLGTGLIGIVGFLRRKLKA
ncbi:MAG: PEP-CTERM sorting domain-containing protein [Candidatus Sulfotelmatobacter sp.]